MIYTNNHKLPSIVFNALTNRGKMPDGYVKSDISVSALMDSPQVRILRKRHKDMLQEDAMDRVWALLGESVHNIMEASVQLNTELGIDPNDFIAEVLGAMVVNNWRIGYKLDLFQKSTGWIWDYKVTSAWSLVFDRSRISWLKQTNYYAEFYRSEGHEVKGASIVAILKDWSKKDALRNRDYPQTPIVVLPMTLYDPQGIKESLFQQVVRHQQADQFTDPELPDCTPEEQWRNPTKYAVMRPSGGRSLKNCDTIEEARVYANNAGNGAYVETRPSKPTRCEEYCPVRDFCHQRKREYAESQIKTIA